MQAIESARGLTLLARLTRKHQPKLTASEEEIDKYTNEVDSLIAQYLKTPLRRDLRMGDYAKRIPLAIARASFSDVDSRVLEEAIELMEACIAAW